MRGADSYNESLFTTVRLESFVPTSHPLRPIRTWLNDTLANMDAKFSAMYEADIKGGRPSIAPEKLMRAMLLQVLYSVRSERQLVVQINTTCCSAGSWAWPSKTLTMAAYNLTRLRTLAQLRPQCAP
jgi:hypothetical protein